MSLREYQRKRNFRRTPEPVPKLAQRSGFSYAIQKHAASHLHYDFRLELDGVLKSWAIPKGPSLDTKVRRLAMHVEDHPVEYGEFEGIIPEGEYGGGTVMLWDRGTWEPLGNPHESYRSGKLKFRLYGEKLQGGWMLVKTSRSASGHDNEWLLIKERDEFARSGDDSDVVRDRPLSITSERTLEQIGEDKERVWSANRTSNEVTPKSRNTKSKKPSKRMKVTVPAGLEGAKPSITFLHRVEPKLATLAPLAPEGDRWFHEIKWDGYRMLCYINGGRAEFYTRQQNNWTEKLQELARAVIKLPVEQAVIDGEVVAFKSDGTPDFQALQNAFSQGGEQALVYCMFDLLYLNGHDLRGVTLEERKQLLQQILVGISEQHALRYSEHVIGSGPAFFKQVSAMGLEGIVSKRRDSRYSAGRNGDWLKIKSGCREEFVIGGFTDSSARGGFSALLLGYYDANNQLVYVGKVGTGFSDSLLETLRKSLDKLVHKQSPFANLRVKTGEARGAHWVEPELVAQVSFANTTRGGHLRHASFLGLSEGKLASSVARKKPFDTTELTHRAEPTVNHTKLKTAKPLVKFVPSSTGKGEGSFAGVRLTSAGKVLFNEEGVTKLELAEYYLAIAPWILPHVSNRPLSLVRCPEGAGKECFFQKHPGIGSPKTLRLVAVTESGGTHNYFVVDSAEDLISLAQIGSLEIHVWGSKADKLELPDRMIFDLDPDPTVAWPRVVESAHQIRAFLDDIGLQSFVKTTGGKGLHIVVPIQRRHDWDEVKAFSKRIAELIEQADPSRYTSNMSKAARVGKIYIDYLRNGRTATAIAAYSTRARPRASVSVPVSWDELKPSIRSDSFTVRSLPSRLARLKEDPWAGIGSVRQSLTVAMKKQLGISTR